MIGQRAPGNYSVSIWSYNFSICLWESPTTFISTISGRLDVTLAPKPIICIFGDTRIPKEIKKQPGFLLEKMFNANLEALELALSMLEKTGADKSRRSV